MTPHPHPTLQKKDWAQYWRILFSLSVEDIRSFEKTYKGSEEECGDLKIAYLKHEGDMDHILEEVECMHGYYSVTIHMCVI